MLTEAEWEILSPHLTGVTTRIKQYREAHQCSLEEARDRGFDQPALLAYERITGFRETNSNALFHHRLSLYGPPCHACGKPLRTPRARFCAACGAERPTTLP